MKTAWGGFDHYVKFSQTAPEVFYLLQNQLTTSEKSDTEYSHFNQFLFPCSAVIHLDLHDLTLDNVPLTCGCARLRTPQALLETSRQAGHVLQESDTTRSDHNTGNSEPYSFRTVRGFSLSSRRVVNNEELRDGAYGLSSSSDNIDHSTKLPSMGTLGQTKHERHFATTKHLRLGGITDIPFIIQIVH